MAIKAISEIDIHDLSHDGRGVGRQPTSGKQKQGKTCFVEGALPGEQIKWRCTKSKGSFDEGELVEIIQPSDERVEPRCAYYSNCGGCQLQHLNPLAQLKWKETQLRNMVKRSGLEPESWLPPLSSNAWGYRRRTRLFVAYSKQGKVQIGFKRKASRDLVAIQRCDVLDERLNNLFPLLMEISQELRPYGLNQFELSAAEANLGICLNLKKQIDSKLLQQWIDQYPQLQFWQRLPKQAAQPVGEATPLIAQLTEKTSMAFTPGQFVQVNGSMNRAMIAQALELTQPGKKDRVLDLFSGAGNFSLAFAEQARYVLGAEGSAELCKQAELNAKALGFSNTEFRVVDLDKPEQFGLLGKAGKDSFDLVILDPPRAGAFKLMPWLQKLKAPKMLYISCHPATMVRDIKALMPDYKLDSIGVMDMFPHTAHLEAMALLSMRR